MLANDVRRFQDAGQQVTGYLRATFSDGTFYAVASMSIDEAACDERKTPWR